MSHAEVCPRCRGKGTVDKPGNWAYYNPETGDNAPQMECPACHGKTIIIVP